MKINPKKLRDFIETGDVFYKENAVSFIFNCPRCSKPKLYIHKQNGNFICFKCASEGFKGSAEYALAEIFGVSLGEIRAKFKDEYLHKKYLEIKLNDLYQEKEDGLLDIIEFPNYFLQIYQDGYQPGMDYLLNKRGLRNEHLIYYDIRYNPTWKTVVFPVYYKGNLFGWQERSINSDFKYTLKGFKKEKILMFQDNLINSKHAVLTEGPVDALKCHVLGGNVCSMGKGVSKDQLNLLVEHVKRVYIGLDPDADKEIHLICQQLLGLVEVYIIKPPEGVKDFGECTEKQVIEQFELAEKYYPKIII